MQNPKYNEETSFKTPASIKGITIRLSNFKQPSFKKHFHPFYSIGVIEAGEGSVLLNNQCFKLYKKASIFINPQEVHACNPVKDSNWSFKMFYIDNSLIEKTVSLAQFTLNDLPRFKKEKSFNIQDYNLIQNLYQSLSSPESNLSSETTLFLTLAEFLNLKKSYRENQKDDKMVKIIKDFLHENYQRKISLQELSSLTNKSIHYMCRTFSSATGLPPHSYQNQIQIEKAKTLLKNQKKPLCDIALEAGFYDQAHFSKKFKNFTGVSPKKYRKLISN